LLKAGPPSVARRLRWLIPGRRGPGLALALIVLLLSAMSSTAASQARVSDRDGVNLRDAPSLQGSVLALLAYGTVVDVVGSPSDDGWLEVGASGRLGYVKAAYLDFSAPVLRGSALVSTADGVHLRTAPSTTASVLATLPPGRLVRITGDPTSDNWYPVQAAEGTGWVDGAYLQAAPPNSSPVLIRWYGHDFDGGVLACGGVYNADDATIAATTSWPCGTRLKVCAAGKCVDVVVRDTGRMGPGAMDLSAAAFQRLAPLETGALNGTLQVISN